MNVVSASPADEPWVRQLLTLCGLPHEDLASGHLAHYWVLKEKGEILGSVGLEIHGPFGLLRSLATHPRFRRQGLASELTLRAEIFAASLQIRELYLLTMTAESFFRKRGYQRTERNSAPPQIRLSTEFQSLCPESAICMAKALAG